MFINSKKEYVKKWALTNNKKFDLTFNKKKNIKKTNNIINSGKISFYILICIIYINLYEIENFKFEITKIIINSECELTASTLLNNNVSNIIYLNLREAFILSLYAQLDALIIDYPQINIEQLQHIPQFISELLEYKHENLTIVEACWNNSFSKIENIKQIKIISKVILNISDNFNNYTIKNAFKSENNVINNITIIISFKLFLEKGYFFNCGNSLIQQITTEKLVFNMLRILFPNKQERSYISLYITEYLK